MVGKSVQGENFQILALENEELENLKQGQCLASPLLLKNNDLEVGDKIVLPVYCYVVDMMTGQLTERFITDYEWEIAGSHEMEEDIHIPLDNAKELFEESKNTYYASVTGWVLIKQLSVQLNSTISYDTLYSITMVQTAVNDSYGIINGSFWMTVGSMVVLIILLLAIAYGNLKNVLKDTPLIMLGKLED